MYLTLTVWFVCFMKMYTLTCIIKEDNSYYKILIIFSFFLYVFHITFHVFKKIETWKLEISSTLKIKVIFNNALMKSCFQINQTAWNISC